MSELIEKSLGELSLNVSSGVTPLKSNEMFWTNPTIPWLKTEQLGEKYIYETNSFVSEAALKLTSLRLYPENTLSIAMYGEGKTRGNVSILKKSMTTNQACCNLELDEDQVDIEYVYYYLKTQYEQLRSLSSGVRKNLNANDIKHFKIRLPKEKYLQKVISKTLSCLDQKIALNNQINDQLESMAKTLYDYWFVQFDFPDENGKPYKSSGGKMVYNDQLKREIPEGWESKKFLDICYFKNGINYDKSETGKTLANIINVRNVSSSSFFISSNDLDSVLLDNSKISNYLVDEQTILITRSGIPGATRLAMDIAPNTIYSGFIIGATVSDTRLFYLVFYYLKNMESTMSNRSAGTIMKNISQTILSDMDFIIPKQELIDKFTNYSNSIFEQLKTIQQQNQELTKLRDWLLPMLMNGQVRVK